MVCIIRSACSAPYTNSLTKWFQQQGLYVVGTDIVPPEKNYSSADTYYQVPKASQAGLVIDAYMKLALEHGAHFIISGPEEEVCLLAGFEEDFKKIGVMLFHPETETLKIITNKRLLYGFLDHEFMPRTVLLAERESICSGSGRVVLKPVRGRGSQGVYFTEAARSNEYISLTQGRDYIVQEYIEGDEYTVDILFDMDNRLLNMVMRKRIVVHSGVSYVAETAYDDALFDIIREIADKFAFRGVICMQFIKCRKENRYHLIDINPRFGGGAILSLYSCESFQHNLLEVLRDTRCYRVKDTHRYRNMKMVRVLEESYEVSGNCF